MNNSRQSIDFLTTSVGRGHRFYLEGLHQAVCESRRAGESQLFSAPEVCGMLAGPGWRLIEWLYRTGSSSGLLGAWYNRLRSGGGVGLQDAQGAPGEAGVALRLFGAGLRRWWKSRGNPLVVDHPLLVRLLSASAQRPRLIYMHGELVAPAESLAQGADYVIVPRVDVKRRFMGAGLSSDSVIVSGVCVERSLVAKAEQARILRLERLQSGKPLTGGFFSSGAEPVEHCRVIVSALQSFPPCDVERQGSGECRAIVFAKANGRLAKMVSASGTLEKPGIKLITYDTIADEEQKLASVYTDLDYYVAPSHERTNWAVGLGLPFFVLTPCVGSYAPLNLALAEQSCSAKRLSSEEDAIRFYRYLTELQSSGALEAMNRFAESAEARTCVQINGFERAAELLLQRLD